MPASSLITNCSFCHVEIPVLNYVSAPGILSTEAMILVRQHTLSVEFGFTPARETNSFDRPFLLQHIGHV